MSKVIISILGWLLIISILLTGCRKESAAVETTSAFTSTTPDVGTSVLSTGANNTASTEVVAVTPVLPPVTSLSTVQEVAAGSLKAAAGLQSLKFDMDLLMSFDFPEQEQTRSMTMQETATGSVDIPGKAMVLAIDMVMETAETGKRNYSAEMYSTDGWVYVKSNLSGESEQWVKMKFTEELWAQQSQLAKMTDFLKSADYLEISGSETINGINCFVLSITPDTNSLSGWLAGSIPSGQSGLDLSGDDMSEKLHHFAVTEWIAKDSYLPVKQQIIIEFNETSDSETTGSAIGHMSLNATTIYYDFGKTVTIQLPAAASNATEVTLPQ